MQTTWTLLTAIQPLVTRLTTLGYLDPGTGSYALQLLLAGAFGGLFALKQSWQQCRAWWSQSPLGRRLPLLGGKTAD